MIKTVEFTFWHTVAYLFGCVLIAFGVALVIRSEIGTSPWDTLHVAINLTSLLTVGAATIVVAIVSTLIVVFMRMQPKYLWMAIPIVLVGVLIDFFNLIVLKHFNPEPFTIRLILFISSVLMLPLGGAFLIVSTYPAGVFDELMLALMHAFKTTKMIRVRIMLDTVPVMIALALTLTIRQSIGSLQVGTVVFVMSVGPLLKRYLTILRRIFMKMNKFIDHTYLKAFGTKEDIDQLLDEAITYDFKSVCVNPSWVAYAAESLKKSDVLVCTVIGFPLGASTTKTKLYETEDALKNGADEIDMVLNVGWVKSGQFDKVHEEIKAIKSVCQKQVLKVILETCYLTDDEIKRASQAAFDAGADFVKTSTGFGTGGATLDAVRIMSSVAAGKGVKASGGVKTVEDFNNMIEAGATRIGTSSGVSLMKGETSDNNY